jgi:hypothetical protein
MNDGTHRWRKEEMMVGKNKCGRLTGRGKELKEDKQNNQGEKE